MADGFSKYHLVIITFYVAFIAILFSFIKQPFSYYHFSISDGILVAPFLLAALASFYFLNKAVHLGEVKAQSKKILNIAAIIFYAVVLISIPEEILFRGVIQRGLQDSIENSILSILFASGIFGLAHVFNGASSMHISKWNWKLAIFASIAGIFLGYSFVLTSSLVLPTILHALFIISFKFFLKETPAK